MQKIIEILLSDDVFYLSYESSKDPRALTANIFLCTKSLELSIPLTNEVVPTFVTLLNTLSQQKQIILFTYDVKDLILILKLFLQKQSWKPSIDWSLIKIFDVCYLERFAGLEAKAPKSLAEARNRFKKVFGNSIHKDIHIPLALEVLPEMENTPLLKNGEGYVYCHYHVEGQTNGRLNCDKPGKNYYLPHTLSHEEKLLLTPSGDQVFLMADYHAMEVFFLAQLSNDRRLDRITSQPDVYRAICQYVFDCTKEEAKEHRNLIKNIFLPVMYGMTPSGISQAINVSPEFAEKLFIEIHSKFPEASSFLKEVENQAAKYNQVTDSTGRTRPYLNRVYSARNAIVQSVGAKHCLNRLIAVKREIKGIAEVVASIHDSYLIQCHPSCIKEVVTRVKNVLESGKLKTRLAIGKNLGTLEKYED